MSKLGEDVALPEGALEVAKKAVSAAIGNVAMSHKLTNLEAVALYRQTLRVTQREAERHVLQFHFGR